MNTNRSRPPLGVRRIAPAHLALLGLALTQGCATDTTRAPVGARPDPWQAQGGGLGDLLVNLDPTTEEYLLRGTPIVTKNPLRVQETLRWIDDRGAITVEYRFVWFDASGRMVDADRVWKSRHLRPRIPAEIRGLATDSRAVRYRLEIRPDTGR